MQLVQGGNLTAQVEVGIGNAVLLYLDAAHSLVDVMEAEFVHLAAQVALGQLQLVDLLALEAAVAALVIGGDFEAIRL